MADQHRPIHAGRAGAVLEVADDLRVGVEDLLTPVVRHGRVKTAPGVHRSHRHDPHGVGGGLVVLAVRRGHMHDPGAVLGGDEVAGQYLEAVGGVGEIREWRQIPQAQ